MYRIAKYVLVGFFALTVLSATVVFFRPSLLINKSTLIRMLKTAPVTYEDIDLTLTSPGVFERAMSFSAQGLCINNEKVDICLPNVALDIVLGIHADGLRIERIKQFVLRDANVKIDLPESKESQEIGQTSTVPEDEERKKIRPSLALRALELIADLRRDNVLHLGIERLTYIVNFKGSPIKGELNLTRTPDAILLDVTSLYRGAQIQLLASFGKEIHLSVSLMGRPLVALRTDADLFKEFFEYLRSTELYWLRTKHLPVNVDIKNLARLLDHLGYSQPSFDGTITGMATLNFNKPSLGDAFFGFHFFGEIVDGQKKMFVDGELDYHILQKIPLVRIKKLKSSAGDLLPAEDYRSFALLSDVAKYLDVQMRYEWIRDELTVRITRDYSKLPRKAY